MTRRCFLFVSFVSFSWPLHCEDAYSCLSCLGFLCTLYVINIIYPFKKHIQHVFMQACIHIILYCMHTTDTLLVRTHFFHNHSVLNSPTVLVIGENVTLVVYTCYTVLVTVTWRKHLVLHVVWLPSSLSVFWLVVPQQTHHHLLCEHNTCTQR